MTSIHVRKLILRTCLAIAAMAAVPAVAYGQTASVTLSGLVKDAQSGVLPGATVVVVYEPTGARQQTVTAQNGRYTLTGLRAGGPYRVTASMPQFKDGVSTVTLDSGQEKQLDFSLQLATIKDTLTVRAGTALARDEKRSAANIMDVVSADAVGRFPDANAAEALRRVPGVSMEIDQGEGRFVVVRGIDASLNNVTLNGQIVGTPAEFGTRGVSMDAVPADLISRLEVAKAVTPDMDGNAIGASINIKTVGAFDRPGGFFSGAFRSGYNELSGRKPVSSNATYGRTFGSKVGVVFGGSYSDRHFGSELFRGASNNFAVFNGFFVPQTPGLLIYDIQRRRQGYNGSVAVRPKNGHEITLRVNRNLFRDIEGRQQAEFDMTLGTLTNQTPTSGSFSQGRASRQFRDYEQHHTIDAAMLKGVHTVGLSVFDWQGGFSSGKRDTPRRVDWEFRSASGAFPNTYDVTDPSHPIFTPTANFYDAASYPFRRVRFRTDLEREDVITGEANLQRQTTFAGRGTWKAGVKLVARDKLQDRNNQDYNTGPAFTLADFGLGLPSPPTFFDDHTQFGPRLNLPVLKQFFADNPGRFVLDPLATLSDSLVQDFTASEQVTAAYAMRTFTFTRWSLLAGVRVEHTSGDYAANELVLRGGNFTGNIRPANGSTSYTNVLPGVHLTFFPRNHLTIRAAVTSTIGRPAYASLAPIKALDDIENPPTGSGVFTGSLSLGNPDLKPYKSLNVDGSIEYYLGSGHIAVAPFYKHIDNPIYGLSFTETNVMYEERLYSTLAFSQPANADAGHIGGAEFTYQNYFTKLPGVFNGLGVNLNYTLTDSSVTVFGRTDVLPFFKQSKHSGTVALLYEKFGWASQLSLSFNSPNLGTVGTNVDSDNYGDTYKVVDFKVSAPITRGVRGLVELGNINNEYRRRYAGRPELRTQDERYSWNLSFGVDWRFR